MGPRIELEIKPMMDCLMEPLTELGSSLWLLTPAEKSVVPKVRTFQLPELTTSLYSCLMDYQK